MLGLCGLRILRNLERINREGGMGRLARAPLASAGRFNDRVNSATRVRARPDQTERLIASNTWVGSLVISSPTLTLALAMLRPPFPTLRCSFLAGFVAIFAATLAASFWAAATLALF